MTTPAAEARLRLSLQAKVLIGTVTIVSAALFLFGARIIGEEKKLRHEQMSAKAELMAHAAVAAIESRSEPPPELQDGIKRLMSRAGIASLRVESAEGTALDLPAAGRPGETRVFAVTVPAKAGGAWTASVGVLVRDKAPGRALDAAQTVTLMLVLTIAVMVAALTVIVREEVLLPVSKTIEAAEAIARGDLERRVTAVSDDELGDLAAAINGMVGQLRKARDEAQAHSRTLEARVRERTAELSRANAELESFAYSASHDLQAPIRNIDAFCALLQAEHAGALDETGRKLLDRMRAGCRRMSEVIEGLLSLARSARREMRRSSVDPAVLAREVMDRLRESEPGRKARLVLSAESRPVCGDPVLLREALENLLGNAWKFTRKTEEARIEFGSRGEGEETVYFVKDNGAGFDMKYADRLFHPFHRLHAASEFPGSGIGLSTVQRIVERHGGRIWAEAAEGAGATFFFTLGPGGETRQSP